MQGERGRHFKRSDARGASAEESSPASDFFPQSPRPAHMNLSELSGAELDFWVAKAIETGPLETLDVDKYGAPIVNGTRSLSFLIQKYADFPQAWSPSTKWEDGGPIIESSRLSVEPMRGGGWIAFGMGTNTHVYTGESFLCVAMRAFVASRLGDKC